jgi:CheY-like chemotaxis protein
VVDQKKSNIIPLNSYNPRMCFLKIINVKLIFDRYLNTGNTVCFKLKFIIPNKLSEEQPTETQLDLNNYSELGPLKILLAEDNTINQFLAQTILHEFGFEVDTADNGKIAIEFLNKKNYDIVLMDLKMPEMGGFEATKYIRTQMAPPKSTVPIIAITADVTQADIDKYKEAGMNDYVIKPFNQMELLNKIMSLIRENNDHEIINH